VVVFSPSRFVSLFTKTLSISPKFTASCADMKLSRSMAFSTRVVIVRWIVEYFGEDMQSEEKKDDRIPTASIVLLVCLAYSEFSSDLIFRISLA